MLDCWERQARRRLAQGFCLLGVGLALSAAAGDGPPKKPSTVERIPDRAYRPKRGDHALAYTYDWDRDAVYATTIFRDAATYQAYWRANEIRDRDGAMEILNGDRAVRLAPKTGLLVLEVETYPAGDPRPDAAVVRVLDGPSKGLKLWAEIFAVCRLVENPDYVPPATPKAALPPLSKPASELTIDEVRRIREGAARQMADSYLNIARNLEKSGKRDQAAQWYRRVVKEFPAHPEADTARQRLRTMGEK